ncbi:Cilia- and flagella-associated protein [Dirofilaria immitis]
MNLSSLEKSPDRLHFIGIGDDDNFKIPNYEGEVTRYSQIGHQTNCCICFPRQLDIVKKFHIEYIVTHTIFTSRNRKIK